MLWNFSRKNVLHWFFLLIMIIKFQIGYLFFYERAKFWFPVRVFLIYPIVLMILGCFGPRRCSNHVRRCFLKKSRSTLSTRLGLYWIRHGHLEENFLRGIRGLEHYFTVLISEICVYGSLKIMSLTIILNVAAIDTQYCILIPRLTRGKI